MIKIQIQFDNELLQHFKSLIQSIINVHVREERFQKIQSLGKKEVGKYINKIMVIIETNLSIATLGHNIKNASQYAELIFFENKADFILNIGNEWNNIFVLKEVESTFSNSAKDYMEELNKILYDQLKKEKEEAIYFLKLHKLEWKNSTGIFEKDGSLSFEVNFAFNFQGISKLDSEIITDIEEDKNKSISQIREKMIEAGKGIIREYIIKSNPQKDIKTKRLKCYETLENNNVISFCKSLDNLLRDQKK